jgi:uncharacterized repeat protein (TIGR01451 family)
VGLNTSCVVGPVTAVAGTQTNTATADSNETGPDSDIANYNGTELPAIDVEKSVSVDGGLTWLDADMTPGPNLLFGINPQFLFTVRNTGNVTLTGITLTDSDFATTSCTIPGSRTADDGTNGSGTDEFTCTITGVWAAGQHTNTATATGIYNSSTYPDTDDANYFGIDPGYRMCNSSGSSVQSGTIKDSGGSSLNYSNNENCTFLISSGYPSASIKLTFASFNTESGYDFLRIYDGTSALSPSLGTFSGTSLPGAVTATSGNMFLRFTSDVNTTEPGFVADWVTTINPTDYSMCSGATSSANLTGSISDSGGVSSNYGNNEFCSFRIQPGGGGSTITLTFSQFNTENVSSTDHLIVYDGIDSSGVNLGDFWGPTTPSSLTANSGSMFLQWASDISNTFPGYIASWTSEAFNPSIVLTKTANPVIVDSAGDAITYTFSIQNTGNVPLTNISLNDTLLSGLSCSTINNLLPGASQTFACTGNAYVTTQNDFDNNGGGDGFIENTATVVGMDPGGGTTTDDSSTAVAIMQSPTIRMVKEVSVNNGVSWFDANSVPGQYYSAGINPRFRFTVTNSGNVTLVNLNLSDPEVSGFYKSDLITACGFPASLSPGDYFTCYAQLPGLPGQQSNTATASGEFNSILYSDSDDAYYFGSVPSIVLTKTANPTSIVAAGNVITYTFSVQNTGNSPLSNITLSDSMLGGLICSTINDLQPGTSQPFSCSGNTHTVTQSEIDNNGGGDGDIDNTATVQGYAPDGAMVSDSDSTAVTFSQIPGLTLMKSADRTNVVAAGEVITYSFSVQNTGNVTITGIALTDSFLTGISCDTVASLLPGGIHSFSCSGNTYTVTPADIGSGSIYIVNTATVLGIPISGGSESDSDSVAVYLPPPAVSTIQPGLPDGTFYNPPNGATLVYNMGIPLYAMTTPDGNPDLVYFERNADLYTVQMDSVIVELGDFFLDVWYMIFNWGNGVADTNSNLNINNPAVGGFESDNQVITKTTVPLYGTPSLNTGITIDIDGYAPAGTPYQWLRISVPTGGAGDGADIDSILVLPTKTPTPPMAPSILVAPLMDTPVPTEKTMPTPEPPTPEPPPPTPTR